MIHSSAFTILPSLIVHADWGSHSRKRWMASATLSGNTYLVHPTEPVGDLGDFLNRVATRSDPAGSVLIGFDFPIGLPYTYAQRVGINDFSAALSGFGQDEWDRFFDVAQTPEQISLYRPFYPYRPGGTRRQHLLDKLGFSSIDELRRKCEKAPPLRRTAAPLFWTLGAQQVGKAALIGWRDVIVPGLEDATLDLVIWPFSGKMAELVSPGRVIITETYPAEYLHQLNLIDPGSRFSKRNQGDRARAATVLHERTPSEGIAIHPDLECSMRDGFGSNTAGDDLFDAVIGLFGILQFFNGKRELHEPESDAIRHIEGWIFGLSSEKDIV